MSQSMRIPRGMQAKDVAETMTAYLLGAAAFSYRSKPNDPIPSRTNRTWQLDGSNDYWLREDDGALVSLVCRYASQQPVVDAMAALFRSRYGAKDQS